MLADRRFPFFKWIWFGYIFWIGYFASGYLKLYRDDMRRITAHAYCQCVDALLGGDRSQQFLELRKAKIAELKQQTRARAERRRSEDEVLFRLRLQHEARVNPNFVATNHTHQDR